MSDPRPITATIKTRPATLSGSALNIGRILDRLMDISGTLSGGMLIVCAVLVVWQVFARRVFHQPTHWVPDLTVYILIWIGFLAAGYGLKEGSHVIVDCVVENLRPRVRAALDTISYAVVAVYSGLFTIYALGMTIHSFRLHEVAFTELPMAIGPVKLGVPVGMALLTLQSLSMGIKSWQIFSAKDRGEEDGSLRNCALVVIAFAGLIALGTWLFNASPLAGSLIILSALLCAGIPIGFSLGVIGCIGLYLLFGDDQGFINMPVMGFSQLNSFTLVALPLFMIAGSIARAGRLADKLFDVGAAFVGHWPGGLGVATIGACAIFAAISGSSVATAATIGTVAVPVLVRKGYPLRFVCGIVSGGGTLGALIPPCSTMIIFAVLTDESLGRLFMACVIPGILLAAMLSAYVMIRCRRSGEYKREPWVPWKEKWRIVRSSVVGLAMPVLILGLIYSGTVYATEAAGVAVLYALGACVLEGTIKWRNLLGVLRESAKITTMIFMMIIGSVVIGGMVSIIGFTEQLVQTVANSHLPPNVVVLLLMLLLIVLGTYLEPIAMMFLFLPIAAPVLKSLHVSLVWFAVLFAINMEMAIISPPVGTTMNVVQGIAGASFNDVNRGVVPMILIMAVAMLLIGLIPQLALWLPSIMMK